MIHSKTILLLSLLGATVQFGCNKTPPATSAASSPAPAPAQNSAIELEIVSPQDDGIVSGVVMLRAEMAPPDAAVTVTFFVDGKQVGRTAKAPFDPKTRKGLQEIIADCYKYYTNLDHLSEEDLDTIRQMYGDRSRDELTRFYGSERTAEQADKIKALIRAIN